MEGTMLEREDEKIGNKRGRDIEKGNMGRLEKRPSGVVVLEEYSGDEMINGVKYEEEKIVTGGGGLFNQLITNLVNSPRSNNQEVESGGFEGGSEKNGYSGDHRGDGGEVGGEDGGGGVINKFISNVFGGEVVEKNGGGGGGGEVVEKDSGGGEVVEDGGGENEKEGGGNIIDDIVAQLPRSLSEDTAPATDEASILIHSIIHD